MHCEERFQEIYNRDPDHAAFCPCRICPLGAHVDHNLGKITGLAIDKGIHIAYSPKHNGVIELVSLQFDKRAQRHISSTPEEKQNDWADYLRGATIELTKLFPLRVGLCGVIEGTLCGLFCFRHGAGRRTAACGPGRTARQSAGVGRSGTGSAAGDPASGFFVCRDAVPSAGSTEFSRFVREKCREISKSCNPGGEKSV